MYLDGGAPAAGARLAGAVTMPGSSLQPAMRVNTQCTRRPRAAFIVDVLGPTGPSSSLHPNADFGRPCSARVAACIAAGSWCSFRMPSAIGVGLANPNPTLTGCAGEELAVSDARGHRLDLLARLQAAPGGGARGTLLATWAPGPSTAAGGCTANTTWPRLQSVVVLGVGPVDISSVSVTVPARQPAGCCAVACAPVIESLSRAGLTARGELLLVPLQSTRDPTTLNRRFNAFRANARLLTGRL